MQRVMAALRLGRPCILGAARLLSVYTGCAGHLCCCRRLSNVVSPSGHPGAAYYRRAAWSRKPWSWTLELDRSRPTAAYTTTLNNNSYSPRTCRAWRTGSETKDTVLQSWRSSTWWPWRRPCWMAALRQASSSRFFPPIRYSGEAGPTVLVVWPVSSEARSDPNDVRRWSPRTRRYC